VQSIVQTYVQDRPRQQGELDLLGASVKRADAPRQAVDVDDEVLTHLRFANGAVGAQFLNVVVAPSAPADRVRRITKRWRGALTASASWRQAMDSSPRTTRTLGTISQVPDQLDRILRLSDTRLCPDVAHLLAGGVDPAEVIRRYRDRVAYVH
jgi:hypothetical protein